MQSVSFVEALLQKSRLLLGPLFFLQALPWFSAHTLWSASYKAFTLLQGAEQSEKIES